MARPLRIQTQDATYHVTANSTFGRRLFIENDDRRWFEYRLDDVIRRYEWSCKAHCLLGTHYHLLVTTPEPNLAAGMKRLNGVHAQAVNDRHEQFGPAASSVSGIRPISSRPTAICSPRSGTSR